MPVGLDLQTEFKYRIRENNKHVNAYFGLRNSIDGYQYLLGFKVAGIKIKFPIYIIDGAKSVSSKEDLCLKDELMHSLKLLGVFFAGSCLISYVSDKLNQRKIEDWKKKDLSKLTRKQEDTLTIIKDRAIKNQNLFSNKLKVLRAYYGQKSKIVKYLETRSSDLNQIERKTTDSISNNDPYCMADVTVAIWFALDAQKGGLHLQKMSTKTNIMGFYNPIPPYLVDNEHPVLCIIYKEP